MDTGCANGGSRRSNGCGDPPDGSRQWPERRPDPAEGDSQRAKCLLRSASGYPDSAHGGAEFPKRDHGSSNGCIGWSECLPDWLKVSRISEKGRVENLPFRQEEE
jgi:hypothetical protein